MSECRSANAELDTQLLIDEVDTWQLATNLDIQTRHLAAGQQREIGQGKMGPGDGLERAWNIQLGIIWGRRGRGRGLEGRAEL